MTIKTHVVLFYLFIQSNLFHMQLEQFLLQIQIIEFIEFS